MIYKNTKTSDKGIKIFDQKFINNNSGKCKIYINEEEIDLSEFYEPKQNEKYIKIKLNINEEITDMSYMFYNCTSLISVTDISYWNTYAVTDMSYMFYNCISLNSFDVINSFDIFGAFIKDLQPKNKKDKSIKFSVFQFDISGKYVIFSHS